MTKTTLTLLAGGAAVLALAFSTSFVRSDALRETLAWEQPPILAPRPGTDIIIIKGTTAGATQLAWEQPPILAPRPGTDIIIIKGAAAGVAVPA